MAKTKRLRMGKPSAKAKAAGSVAASGPEQVVPPDGPPGITPEQKNRAAQQLRTAHAVLKAQFADASVALAMVINERDQLIVQLRSAQATLEAIREETPDAGADALPNKDVDKTPKEK